MEIILSKLISINDWEIKKFLIAIFSIQIAVLGLISLDLINIHVPIIRELICFIYLTFIPGFLILRILKIRNLKNVLSISYSIGLSISTLMLIALFMNTFYPLLGLNKPISTIPLILTLTIFTILLSIISYFIDDHNQKLESHSEIKFIPFKVLFLLFLPFLAILSTYIFNFYGMNFLQIFILMIITIFPIITLKYYPKKYYYLVLFILSLTLLYFTSLISPFIWGFDIQGEYYFSVLTLKNYVWNPNYVSNVASNNLNAMLSVVFVPAIYSLIMKISIVSVFKIIYPILFSFVPLGLYQIYKEQTTEKIAFLSCFFFISIFTFFTVMPAVPRQELAELFLVLVMMLIFNRNDSNKMGTSILFIIFGSSIVVSHYGLTYIFIFILILGLFLSFIWMKKSDFKKIQSFFVAKKNFILLLIVFAIAWFMYVSNSSVFNISVAISNNIMGSVTDLFSQSQAANIVSRSMPFFLSIERYLNIVCQFCIFVGLIILFKKKKFIKEYNINLTMDFEIFALASFFIAITGITLPFFSNMLNSDRLYHMMLFFLSPFFVIGALILIQFMKQFIVKITNIKIRKSDKPIYIISIFLIVYFIFSSSLIYEVFDQPKLGRFALDNEVDFSKLDNQEILAVKWLDTNANHNLTVFADLNRAGILNNLLNNTNVLRINTYSFNNATRKNYLFLGSYNTQNQKIYVVINGSGLNIGSVAEYDNISNLDNFSKIYDDGKSNIIKDYFIQS